MVDVAAGATLTGYTLCYGRVSIAISSVTPRKDSLTVAFTVETAALASALRSSSLESQLAAVEYTATCTWTNGGATRSNTGTSSPIVVTGLNRSGPGLLIAGLFLAFGGLAFAFSAPRRRPARP